MKTKHQFFLIIFFTLFLNNLYAQDEKKYHKGFHLHLKNAFYQYAQENVAVRASALSYSFGYHITYDFTPKVGIRIGARLSGMKFSQVQSFIYAPCNLIAMDVDFTSSYIMNHHRVTYIGIPLNAKVKLAGGKNHLYLSGGMEVIFSLISGGSQTTVECGELANVNSNYSGYNTNRFNFKLNGGIGCEFEVTKRLFVFFEPQIEYTLNNLTPNTFNSPQANVYIDKDIKALELGMMVGIKF